MNPSTHPDYAASEATGAQEIGVLGYVLQRSVVEVTPAHCLAVAIRKRTLHRSWCAPHADELPNVIAGKIAALHLDGSTTHVFPLPNLIAGVSSGGCTVCDGWAVAHQEIEDFLQLPLVCCLEFSPVGLFLKCPHPPVFFLRVRHSGLGWDGNPLIRAQLQL